MKDVTSFGKLVKYLENDPSTSSLIIVKDERLDLVEVAECFVSNDGATNVKLWLRSEQIERVFSSRQSMPLNRFDAVEVIRVIPFFILKSLNRRYE